MDKVQANATLPAPLAGLRVLDCSLLGPCAVTGHLADFGADVVKVEAPGGDYIRKTGWPVVDGASLLHWHVNRGKRSIVLDIKSVEADKATFMELVKKADVLLEGMRPGALAKLGFPWEKLIAANPKLVFCSTSGYGSVGPYAQMPAHGFAFDSWAGVAPPTKNEAGFTQIPPTYIQIGFIAGPLFAAFGILAGVIRARATGQGSRMEVSQSTAAAYFNWQSIEGHLINEKEAKRKGEQNTARPPGAAGMAESVRYQYYSTKDGCLLFMPSERKFWQNFCAAIDRNDLFEAHPGAEYADHARGNVELRRLLTDLFLTRTTDEWLKVGLEHNIPMAPVNTIQQVLEDKHFKEAIQWYPAYGNESDTMATPVRFLDEPLRPASRAPEPGQHQKEVLRDWLNLK